MTTNTDPHEQAALAWMARRHSGRWSERDAQDWQAWMDADPAHAAAWHRVQRAWDELGGLAEVSETELRPARPVRPWYSWRWVTMLAGTAALLLMVWLILPPGSFAPAHIERTAVGEQRELTLPDGSTLELNTDSVVRIDYGLSCRCISVLWGEAYFKVAHDDPRPFRVRAGSGAVYDIGTAFVVREGAQVTRVGVLEGAVQVRTGQFRRILHAGKVLAFNKEGAQLDIRQRAADLAAWRHGKLVFRDTPLPEALHEFARYQQLSLRLDPRLSRIHINGTYPAEGLSRFLNMLQKAYPLKVERGDVLRIDYRG